MDRCVGKVIFLKDFFFNIMYEAQSRLNNSHLKLARSVLISKK